MPRIAARPRQIPVRAVMAHPTPRSERGEPDPGEPFAGGSQGRCPGSLLAENPSDGRDHLRIAVGSGLVPQGFQLLCRERAQINGFHSVGADGGEEAGWCLRVCHVLLCHIATIIAIRHSESSKILGVVGHWTFPCAAAPMATKVQAVTPVDSVILSAHGARPHPPSPLSQAKWSSWRSSGIGPTQCS